MAEEAFQCLKTAMLQLPVLELPDFSKMFEVETDASSVGIGAVLMQKKMPLAYFSRALPPTHYFKAVYEKELMAIVFTVQKWRPNLMVRRFIMQMDQKSPKFLLEQWVIARE